MHETKTRVEAVKKWADEAIQLLALGNVTQFDLEVSMIAKQLEVSELIIIELQAEPDFNYNDPTHDGKGLDSLRELGYHLDRFEVKRTRASEVIVGLSINNPNQAKIMAGVLKRLAEINKSKLINASTVNLILMGGIIKDEFFEAMERQQRGSECGVYCNNLLDIAQPEDFEG